MLIHKMTGCSNAIDDSSEGTGSRQQNGHSLSKKRKLRKSTTKIGETREPSRRLPQSPTLRKSRRGLLILTWLSLIAITTVVVAALLARSKRESVYPIVASKQPSMPDAKFVGSAGCATCHDREATLWRGSHHQLAMQPAANSTVLGDFNNASFTDNGITSIFFRNGSKYSVRTDGPDGALHDYAIKYTFGVYPLQQYLIEMQGGRLQALGIAWDSRPLERGGQRWFFLHPNERITHRDSRHWTSIDQTWNFMCADCHSTNVRKNYDALTHTYATRYAEINVACEACHGPGSNHVAWAKRRNGWEKFQRSRGLTIALAEREGVSWPIDPVSGNPHRSAPRASEHEIQMCARCHSRRGEIHEDYVHDQPAGDDYRIALLDGDLYFPDGQIKGEVYEYGSFIQSKMYQAGVTCGDCHEPHSLKLRANGNNVCLQCHSEQRYNSPKHHFHQIGSRGAQCVECHMPTRTYMVVDARRDHSLRIPRPDLSVKLGTPNACTNCHTGKSVQWASDSWEKWYGHTPLGFQHFAEALHSGIADAPGAQQALADLVVDRAQPGIARATALSMLANQALPSTGTWVRASVADDSALVRRAAARALANSAYATSGSMLAPLLCDPVRAVRIEAAEVLGGVPLSTLRPDVAKGFSRATEEYVAAQEFNADRPEAHLNLGLLYARENHLDRAEAELKTALSVDPTFAPAAVNLADLYREQNRDQAGEQILRDAVGRSPDDASLQHALGLLEVRQGRAAEALERLAAAVRLDRSNARYAYVYAVALNDAGRVRAAIEVLETSIQIHPYDRNSLAALASFLNQAGDFGKALGYAGRLEKLEPDNPEVRSMRKMLSDHPHD
jgi:predicted CXXCH cytochrome family protein